MCQIQKHCSGLEVKLSPAGLQGSDVKSASLHLIAHPMGKVTSVELSAPCRDSCTLNLPLTFGPAGGGIHCPPPPIAQLSQVYFCEFVRGFKKSALQDCAS